MKKLLSLLICVILVVSVCCAFPLTASADDTLTVTDDYGHSVTLQIGQDVLYTVGLYAGSVDKIINAQAKLQYPAEKLDVDLFGDFDVDEDKDIVEVDYDAYMMPMIKKASLFINPDIDGDIFYNFSKASGVALFDSTDIVFFRARFKATAPGTANIATTIEYIVNTSDVKVYNNCVPDPTINPYYVTSLEAAQYIIGDVDNDWNVTIKDAA